MEHDPNYAEAIAAQTLRLAMLRDDPALMAAYRADCKVHPARFIDDFGTTADPRRALLLPPRPVITPFKLYPKQKDLVEWIMERAKAQEPGLVEKSRDCGISWLCMALAVTLCVFNRDINVGVGSAKEDKVDRSGDPDTLFHKARTFLKHLPAEFRAGHDPDRHSAHLRLFFPETNSTIVGEAGSNIGRGGRTTLFIIDESAHIERPELIEASLASNCDCRIDVSSVRGMANVFAQKRHSGRVKVFTYRYSDDPRKNADWERRTRLATDSVTWAAEYGLDYRGSVEGQLIPAEWIECAIDAHRKLGIEPTGAKTGGFDIADEGKDRCAIALRHGILLEHLQSWSGRGSDLFKSLVRAFGVCDLFEYYMLYADADGMGSSCRGDSVEINKARAAANKKLIRLEPFRGSASPSDPDSEMVPKRKNKDFFANLKAQSWWAMRLRLQQTYRAIAEGMKVDFNSILSIPGELPELPQLRNEMSQPTYTLDKAGKVLVDKQPDGMPSPNLADAVVIAFNPSKRWMEVWRKLNAQSRLNPLY